MNFQRELIQAKLLQVIQDLVGQPKLNTATQVAEPTTIRMMIETSTVPGVYYEHGAIRESIFSLFSGLRTSLVVEGTP